MNSWCLQPLDTDGSPTDNCLPTFLANEVEAIERSECLARHLQRQVGLLAAVTFEEHDVDEWDVYGVAQPDGTFRMS